MVCVCVCVKRKTEATAGSINQSSGHLEARRAQAVSAPFRNFDQQLAFLVCRNGRSELVKRGCQRGRGCCAVFRDMRRQVDNKVTHKG